MMNTIPVGSALMNPSATSCPNWATEPNMAANEAFAMTYGIQIEYDMSNIWWNQGGGFQGGNGGYPGGGLPAILSNANGWNRQTCLTNLIQHMVATGLYWRFYNDDEFSDIVGHILRMNPTIQASVNSAYASGWTSAVVSGTGITFNVVNAQSLPAAGWSQSAGTGIWIQVLNATNTCLNGWYPLLTITSTQWTSNNNGSCANATYAPSGGTTETTAQINVVPVQQPLQNNVSAIPSNLSVVYQGWSANLTSIDCTASPTCTVHWTNHLIPNVAGQAIRIYSSAHGLNGLFSISNWATSSFNITYSGNTGQIAPTAAIYGPSNVTDANLLISVDPNWGADSLGAFWNIINAVSGHPTKSWTMVGSLYPFPTNVYSYEGNPTNTDSSFVYLAVSPGFFGDWAGVWQWINGDTTALQGGGNAAGLLTRPFNLKPRSILWSWGVVNGGATIQTTCRSFTFALAVTSRHRI